MCTFSFLVTATYALVGRRFAEAYSLPVVVVYLLIVISTSCLTKLFRPLQNLRSVLFLHNIVCCTLSTAVVACLIVGLWQARDIFECEDGGRYIRLGLFLFSLSKVYELLDTMFMVLRHKFRQISFLHVFHHATMALGGDYAYNYAAWPSVGFILCLNSMIHMVMYGYYGLTSIYPLHEFTWKRRITQLQLLQFFIALGHAVYGYVHVGYCVYSIVYVMMMIGMFSSFYYHAFVLKKEGKKES